MYKTTRKKSRKRLAFALAAVLLAMPFSNGSAAFEEMQMENTEATVAFTDGTLEWRPPEMGEGDGMNLDFGSHVLPSGTIDYNSINGPHLLRVDDSRNETTAWTVTAKLSNFSNRVDPSNTFEGVITLASPTTPLEPELIVTDPLRLISEDSTIDVLVASAFLDRGDYKIFWDEENTTLTIPQSEYRKLTLASYVAEITWTLIVDVEN